MVFYCIGLLRWVAFVWFADCFDCLLFSGCFVEIVFCYLICLVYYFVFSCGICFWGGFCVWVALVWVPVG